MTEPAVAAAVTNPPAAATAVVVLDDAMIARLQRLINAAPVFAFIKGTPIAPFCKFSRALVELLRERGVMFSAYDVLANPDVREALKQHSGWPTYPQLYIKGKLLGGIDVVKELIASGEFMTTIPEEARGPTPLEVTREECERIIAGAPVVLFLQGTIESPKGVDDNRLITLLQSKGVIVGTEFDVLSNLYIHDAIKALTGHASFPQLFVSGKFVGGANECAELEVQGKFVELFPAEARVQKRA